MGFLSPRFVLLAVIKLGCVSALLSSSSSSKLASFQRLATTKLAADSATTTVPSAQFPLEYYKTPGSTETPHNFGPASPLDAVMHTAERPGNPPEKDGCVSPAQVQVWIDFIRGQGVTNVIALLDEKELAIYEEPGLQQMMEENGMKWHMRPMAEEDAPGKILSLIDDAEQRGEKILCHCTGGIGRCGRVAAAWLVHRYDLSPEVATLIVLDQAHQSGVKRLGHSEKLRAWLGYSP